MDTAPIATRSRRERGAALAEFAILALLVWVLLAGTLELGRAFAAQHVLQNAARVAARELSLRELNAELPFEGDGGALKEIFDPGLLVLDENLLQSCGGYSLDAAGIDAFFDSRPDPEKLLLNRLLRPLMIYDEVDGVAMLRYPGTLLRREAGGTNCEAGSAYGVAIPVLDPNDESRIADWLPVVQPITPPGTGPYGFPISEGGWAALRIHYPFQSAALASWRDTGARTPDGEPLRSPVEAAVTGEGPDFDGLRLAPDLGEPTWGGGVVRPYSGTYGLGSMRVLGRDVRPWRRIISAEGAFRRELFL